MGKKRTFKFQDAIYDIPEEEVEGFLSRKPKAIEVEPYTVGKDTFDVPLDEVPGFLSRKPDAKPLNQEQDTIPPATPIIITREDSFGKPEEDPVLPTVSLDKEGNVSPNVEVPRKTRDAIVGSLMNVPENQLNNPVFAKTFTNEYARRTGTDPRAVKKILDQGIKDYNEYITLKASYDTNPNNTDALYRLGELLNRMGQYDKAAEAYTALQDKLEKIGEAEFADPNNPNKRPDYIAQRVLPALQGLAYTEYLRGNQQESQRLQGMVETLGGNTTGMPSVGEGSYNQPQESPSTYGFSGKRGDDSTPTPASKYLNEISDAIGRSTNIKPMMEMVTHGEEKLASAFNKPGSISELQLRFLTGLAETVAGVAGVSTGEGAVFGLPFMQAQNMVPEETAAWMMPANKIIDDYYKKRGEETPEYMQNVGTLLSFATLAAVHGVAKGGAEAIKGEVQGRRIASAIDKGVQEYANQKEYVESVLNDLSESERDNLVSDLEKRVSEGGMDALAQDAYKVAEQTKELQQDAKTVEEFNAEPEPYTPEKVPGSLAEVKEGTPVTMNGAEGIIERGDDGTWYFTTDEGKSTQIKVEDKFNPVEPLKELGIEVLPEVSADQVARAMADAEQTGWVENKGKRYFVSLDRPGRENATGDVVYEQRADGTLVNRFDSHPDPTFAANRKLSIINKFLAEKGLPPREKLVERVAEVKEPTVIIEQPEVAPEKPSATIEENTAPVSAEQAPEGAVTPEGAQTPISDADKIQETVGVSGSEAPATATQVAEGAPREVQQDPAKEKVTRNSILNLKDQYNAMPKGERSPELREKLNAQAKEMGFEVVNDKGGKIKIIQNDGKRVDRSPVKLTPEQRAEAKAKSEQIKKAKTMPAVDLRQLILQHFLGGGKSVKLADAMHHTGLNAKNFAEFTVGENGVSIHDLWESWRTDPDVEHLIPESDLDFANQFFDVLTEYSDKKQMWQDLLSYADDATWKDMGFQSKEAYENVLFSRMEAAKEGVDINAITEDHYAQAEAEVMAMSDEAVEAMLADLDNNSPKTIEELNTFYEEHGIDPSTEEGITESKTGGTKGEDLGEIREQQAQSPAVKPQGLTPEQPKLEGKAKIHKAIDDLEAAILNMPGIKDVSGGAQKAGVGAAEVVKFVMNRIREGVDAGYTIATAVKKAVDAIKEHETYRDFFGVVNESDFRTTVENLAKEKFSEQGVAYDKPGEQLFGAKHASTDEVRAVLGLEKDIEVTQQHKRDVATVMDQGKKLVDSGLNTQSLADSVIADRRAINADEQAALVYAETQLYNNIVSAEEAYVRAIESGDTAKAKQLQTEINSMREQEIKLLNALEMAGSEMGLAFRMRQVMNKRDYSMAAVERKYTAASGGKEMPDNVRQGLDELVKINEASQKRISELEKALEQQKADQALADIQESIGREKKRPVEKPSLSPEKMARKKELASKFRGMFNDISNVPRLLADKEFLEYGKLVLEEAAGDFKKFVKRLVEDIGEKVVPHAQEIFDAVNKKEYEASYQDDKGIHIDNQLIRDIVAEGVKDSQELVDKVYDVVRNDLPEVTRREVQDAISGYGKTVNPSNDALLAEVNSLKRDLKLESGLEDAQKGKGVKRSGYQRPKPTDKQRELQRKINEELKNHPQDQAELDKKWATALDRTKTGLRNAIADIEKRIEDLKAGRTPTANPKKALLLDQEAKDLRTIRDGLREELEKIEGPREISDEQRLQNAISSAERMKAEYERRAEEIRQTGTFTKKEPVTVSSPELDIARLERDRAKSQYEAALAGTDIPQQAATSRALDAANKKAADLENKIRRNDIGYAARALSRVDITNPELQAAKQRIKDLSKVIQEMRAEQGLVEARKQEMWKSRTKKRIAELERRLRDKDFAKTPKKETELNLEMQRLKMQADRAKFNLDVAIEKARWENQSEYKKWAEHAMNFIGASKSILASADLSAVLRQGAILSVRHPLLAGKAFVEMLRQGWSKQKAEAWHDKLIASDAYILAKNSDLFLSEPMAKILAQEEIFSHNIAERIPFFGRIFAGSNRAYTAYLNKMRMDVFMQHYDALVRDGFKGKELAKEAKAMAYLINNFSGRGSLGKAELAAPVANMLYFAPRFVASRFNTLMNVVSGYYYEPAIKAMQGKEAIMTARARVEAYKSIGAFIGTGYAVLQMAKMAGAEVEDDPRSSDFGKIKVGNTRYDIWGGFQQLVVLFSRIASQAYKDANGEIKEMGEGRNKTTLDYLLSFNRSKMSPQAGLIWDAAKGKFPDNQEFEWSEATKRQVLPLIYQDLHDMYVQEGMRGVTTTAIPMLFGVGVQSYDISQVVKQSGLSPDEVKLLQSKKYTPANTQDKTVYVDGQIYTIPDQDLEKIQKLRAEYAGQQIKENKKDLEKMSDEEFKQTVNHYYTQGLKNARNEVLPEGWSEKKRKGHSSRGGRR